MSHFDSQSHQHWGESIRLAMACMNNSNQPEPDSSSRDPHDDTRCDTQKDKHDDARDNTRNNTRDNPGTPKAAADIAHQLKALTSSLDGNLARQIELLVRFDELEGWRASGAKHCVAWMNAELCIGKTLGWERLRVGRELRRLPILRALFRRGSLGWSKIRLLTRIANPDNQQMLARAALDASVSDVERLCQEFRWPNTNSGGSASGDENADEDAVALDRFERRSLTWRQLDNGNTEIRMVLPPELAQNVLNSVEHCENWDAPACSAIQRRADAAVLMAERSLAYAGSDLSSADRYQVILMADVQSLQSDTNKTDSFDSAPETTALGDSTKESVAPDRSKPEIVEIPNSATPPRRPTIEGAGPVATSTARRIACDASLVALLTENGEPLSIGRKSRFWTPAMRRAIFARDRHCQFPGCDATRHLDIHHRVHWVDGGETSVNNGVSLCRTHHVLVHEGGYRLERASEGYHATSDKSVSNNPDGDNSAISRLLPSRTRFRVATSAVRTTCNCDANTLHV